MTYSSFKFFLTFSLLSQKTDYDYEQSELLLYMHQVMYEGGLYQRSLSHLQQFEDQICDKLSLMEARGKLNQIMKREVKLKLNSFDFSSTLSQTRPQLGSGNRVP